MVTSTTKCVQHQRKSKLRIPGKYLGDSYALFLCFLRNFKAAVMRFVFKASIHFVSFRFYKIFRLQALGPHLDFLKERA